MKNNLKKVLFFIIASIGLALITIFQYKFYETSYRIFVINGLLEAIMFVYFFFEERFKEIFKYVIKFRYLIALIVFILLVIFKINGSSIGFFNDAIYYEGAKDNTIVGKYRGIRSDEFVVHTPYYFSQKDNNYNKISNKMSIEGQDMIIGYNAPVKDISLIAKPFTWGYFINNEIGLSWYWASKVILFILVSFELIMILTKKNEKLSVLGSLLISFSPAIVWWFIPHMADVVFWSMCLVVLAYHFLFNKNIKIKYITSILLALSMVTFIVALFPSLQISIGLMSFILLISLIIRDKEELKIEKKDLIIRSLIFIVICTTILGYTLYTSMPAIKYLMNTVYPGDRVSIGGDKTFGSLFTSLTNIFLPYKNINYSNSSEISNFIHLGVLGLIVFPFIFIKLRKEKDKNYLVGLAFVIVMLIQIEFMLIGFPEWLSKITLFKYINRMDFAYSYTSLLFTLWTIGMIIKYPDFMKPLFKVFAVIIFIGLYYLTIDSNMVTYLPKWAYLIVLVCILVLSLLIVFNKQKLYSLIFFFILLFSCFTVNPIARGASPILGRPVSKFIKEHKDGKYLVLDSFVNTSFVLANGADVPFTVNFYPDYEKWKIVDKNLKYDDVYNRYAHMDVELTEDEFSADILWADHIKVSLNYNDIKKYDIKYIFVYNRELDEELFKKYGINTKIVYNNDIEKIIIYELNY